MKDKYPPALPGEETDEDDIKIDLKALAIRKRALTKRTVIALLLIIAGVCVFIFSDNINLYGLRRLLNIFNSSQPTTDYANPGSEITYDMVDENKFDYYNGNVAILSRNGLELYNSHGDELLKQDLNFQSPSMQSTHKYLLTFDRNGNNVKIFNSYMLVHDLTFNGEIITAKMNENGYFAVASKEKNYKGVVTVYNSNFEKVYEWYSADRYISDVDVSPDNKLLAVSVFDGTGGQVQTSVMTFSLHQPDPIGEVSGIDGLAFSIDFKKDKRLHILTDSALYVTDDYKKATKAFDFSNKYLTYFTIDDPNNTVMIIGRQLSDGVGTLVIADTSGKTVKSEEITSTIKSVDAIGNSVAVLTNDSVLMYNSLGALKNTASAPSDAKKVKLTDGGGAILFRLDKVSFLK
ncbi:MAG: DUF5711 family protein [Bacillota bacterium]|nr:DUF5711 family protein [Bacillota bacterium]